MCALRFRDGTWDKNIFDSVVRHNEYKLPRMIEYDGDGDGLPVVVDIGAHVGSFVVACASRMNSGYIFAYESHPENFELLAYNVQELALQHIAAGTKRFLHMFTHRAAVVGHESPIGQPMELGINTGGCSLVYGDGGSEGCKGNAHLFSGLLFDDLVEMVLHDSKEHEISLLKLDCEGSEWPILLESKKLGRVRKICGELHELPGDFIMGNPWAIVESVVSKMELGKIKYDRELMGKHLEKCGFKVEIENVEHRLPHFWASRK